jgi:hypothetical protein
MLGRNAAGLDAQANGDIIRMSIYSMRSTEVLTTSELSSSSSEIPSISLSSLSCSCCKSRSDAGSSLKFPCSWRHRWTNDSRSRMRFFRVSFCFLSCFLELSSPQTHCCEHELCCYFTETRKANLAIGCDARVTNGRTTFRFPSTNNRIE